MVELLRYSLRLFAAGFMALLSLFVIVGSVAGDFNAIGVGIGLAMAVAAWISWPRRRDAWKSDPPTDRQLAYAANLGIEVPAGATKGEVSEMISSVTGR